VAIAAACSAAPSSGGGTGDLQQAASGTCATPVVTDQSLFVALENTKGTTNPLAVAALKNFSFETVMDQIVATGAKGSTQTALELYDQMVGTLAKAHCTDTINGFPVECPSPEGVLAETNPFTGKGKVAGGELVPVALVNRFDLAPSTGANCGEYRVVFALENPPAGVSRFLMIFEAAMPNPAKSPTIGDCLPIAQFWDDLSATGITSAEFTSKLKTFYFDGIPGLAGNPAFPPVIQAANYGLGGPANTNTGQIRANMLDDTGIWQLREFTLSQACTKGNVCTLTANNTFVKNNPFGDLFEKGGSATFQKEFISQVKTLAATSIPLISMTTPNVDNAGESPESVDTNDYACQAGLGSAEQDFCSPTNPKNTSLEAAIQTELTALKSNLTPLDIIQRATTQACAGCHELSPGTSLGGGLTWPQTLGFVQVDEQGQQSPALVDVFLPFRKTVLTKFIDAHCSSGSTDEDVDPTRTVGGQAVGTTD
jgi:hypothetical protein